MRNWSKERLGWRYWPTVYYYALGRFLRALLRKLWWDFTAYFTGQPDTHCSSCDNYLNSYKQKLDCPHKRIG